MPRRLKLKYSRILSGDMIYLRICLRQLRICLGFSPAQLAHAVGISHPTMVGLERNRRRSAYRPDHLTTLQLVAYCKRPLPPHSTPGLKRAMRELDEVATRIATVYGWEEYSRDIRARHRRSSPKETPEPANHLFIPDDLEDYDDAALRTPKQATCDGLLAHIRLNTDPYEARYVEPGKREELRAAIRQVRGKLDLTQGYMQEDHNISRPTLSRLENLDTTATNLPSRTTLLKLAAICHREGQTEDRKEAGLPLDTEWHRLATILEATAIWPRRNKFAPRGKNRRYLNLGVD